MSAKDSILDFINYLAMLALVAGTIVFLIIPGNFEAFREIMNALAPLVFFAFALLIKIKLSRTEHRERAERQEDELELRINFMTKIWYELASTALPILMLTISIVAGRGDMIDALLSVVAYLFMWSMGKMVFSRKNIV